MPPRAVCDASVLYSASLRDLVVRLAEADLIQVRWTERILDEMVWAVLSTRSDVSADRLNRTRTLMCEAVDDCLVPDYEGLIGGLVLPDPDDRHVLAAAIHSRSGVIITDNIKDFPAEALARYGVKAQRPDVFILRVVNSHPEAVLSIIRAQAASLSQPPMTESELLGQLDRLGLYRSVAALRAVAEDEHGE